MFKIQESVPYLVCQCTIFGLSSKSMKHMVNATCGIMGTVSRESSDEGRTFMGGFNCVIVHFFPGWGVLAAGSIIPHTFLDA